MFKSSLSLLALAAAASIMVGCLGNQTASGDKVACCAAAEKSGKTCDKECCKLAAGENKECTKCKAK